MFEESIKPSLCNIIKSADRPVSRERRQYYSVSIQHFGCESATTRSGAQAERLLGRDAGDLNLIVAHLGVGASMCTVLVDMVVAAARRARRRSGCWGATRAT